MLRGRQLQGNAGDGRVAPEEAWSSARRRPWHHLCTYACLSPRYTALGHVAAYSYSGAVTVAPASYAASDDNMRYTALMSSSSVHAASYLRQREQRVTRNEGNTAAEWRTGHRERARTPRLSAQARPSSQPCRPLRSRITSHSECALRHLFAASGTDPCPITIIRSSQPIHLRCPKPHLCGKAVALDLQSAMQE